MANEVNKIDPSLSGDKLYLILAKGDKIFYSQEIEENIKLSKEQLINIYSGENHLKIIKNIENE